MTFDNEPEDNDEHPWTTALERQPGDGVECDICGAQTLYVVLDEHGLPIEECFNCGDPLRRDDG